MQINIPELSLVVLAGASGSGKSTFARRWFQPTEVVSSDACRAMVSDDENSMDASADAFDLLYYIVGKRLKRGQLTVVDATNIRPEDRKKLVDKAREYHFLPTLIVLNMPEKVCAERNALREDRSVEKRVITGHIGQLKRSLGKVRYEGFRKVIELRSPEEVEAITAIVREPLWNNRKTEKGPFDIIGDVHGCYDELCLLLEKLGHTVYKEQHAVSVHNGRRLVFLGDLVDRGPASPAVLRLVMNAVKEGTALCVPGNHDIKLLRYLDGKNVQLRHGLERTAAQLEHEDNAFRDEIKTFIDGLVSHYVLDEGKLVVAHAGLKENMQGRGSGAVREFCLYGETTGELDEFGLPVRYNWASEYKGKAMVVYGHTPVPEAQWFNNTIDIDTGCVFGGRLTALRYPERDLISVDALEVHCEPARPIHAARWQSLQQEFDEVPDIADVLGKQVIETRLLSHLTIREGHAVTALEVMSRFAVDPKWVIYLPPTMSPSETSELPHYLEHPAEAFAYYKAQGVQELICEEKHMGSRAIVIVCKDAAVVRERFGIETPGIGICYTRTGRRFFNDTDEEQQFLEIVRDAFTAGGFWEEFATDWLCLDAELMPWSAKAQALLQQQYAAVGAASVQALGDSVAILKQAVARLPEAAQLLALQESRAEKADLFREAYGRYCWDVKNITDYRLAPFHLLATEGKTYFDKDHRWHMEQLARYCKGAPAILMATPYRIVQLNDEESISAATGWWETMTAEGKEGMVVKPMDFITKGPKGLVQPAVKIRGQEYLRIIYGPEYDREENLKRLRKRGLSAKRALAMREFALGVEALERFVGRQPLRLVHQCVFGILALESEPVDPRL